MKFLLLVLALSSCYLKSYPVTPPVVEASTYELVVADTFQGTAWVVADHYLVTAGHMCEDPGDIVVIGFNGRKVPATRVIWEMSEDYHADAGILRTEVDLSRPLVLAKEPPKVGEPDGYVGYPLGTFVIALGHHMVDGTDADCDHGASGSAAYTSAGVYGVITRLRYSPSGELGPGCRVTPISEVKELLNTINVGYTETPDELPHPEEDWPPPPSD